VPAGVRPRREGEREVPAKSADSPRSSRANPQSISTAGTADWTTLTPQVSCFSSLSAMGDGALAGGRIWLMAHVAR
jgi:hypothetical protein